MPVNPFANGLPRTSERREPDAAKTRVCSRYHTPHPSDYIAWAQRMLKTHRQARCAGCGLWAVWIPKRSKLTGEQYQRRMEARA